MHFTPVGSTISDVSPAINFEPRDSEFYHYVKDMCIPRPPDDGGTSYEEAAIAFKNRYDSSAKIAGNSHTGTIMEEIINSNFNCDETECTIDTLKSRLVWTANQQSSSNHVKIL